MGKPLLGWAWEGGNQGRILTLPFHCYTGLLRFASIVSLVGLGIRINIARL